MTSDALNWWSFSTAQFAERDLSDAVALLPIATVEQHGPHLPVGVDSMINAGIVSRAMAKLKDAGDTQTVVTLPMMPFGKSTEHLSYPGTLTLDWDTVAKVWFQLGECVRRTGCRRIILFNSHGGQVALSQIVARDLRAKLGMMAVAATWFHITPVDDLFSAEEEKHGYHGGEIETSAMLALHPDLVDMSRARDFRQLSLTMAEENEILSPGLMAWMAEDLHGSGVSGNAAAADAERGEILVDRAADRLITLIKETAAFPIDRLDQPADYKVVQA
ncbi:creatininase family protein [Psychromarinibacter halotolerans]|uniref:Creatininase family protein n=1 Tax=Psychromarinibacter halotolerans TaxID=1775175 RepID=A0ABV7GRK6_9RHOB|nr:creatininase family protein [Psychromarinibacter halotolerans]MDF0595323.1 creatininase family protein [Psychromarinibacter halotolerans]